MQSQRARVQSPKHATWPCYEGHMQHRCPVRGDHSE
nr:MAG TPA: hypothetical protein [Caudoviricetes sp.]